MSKANRRGDHGFYNMIGEKIELTWFIASDRSCSEHTISGICHCDSGSGIIVKTIDGQVSRFYGFNKLEIVDKEYPV